MSCPLTNHEIEAPPPMQWVTCWMVRRAQSFGSNAWARMGVQCWFIYCTSKA